jgi:ABC-type Fe3+ transport system permease subunit
MMMMKMMMMMIIIIIVINMRRAGGRNSYSLLKKQFQELNPWRSWYKMKHPCLLLLSVDTLPIVYVFYELWFDWDKEEIILN